MQSSVSDAEESIMKSVWNQFSAVLKRKKKMKILSNIWRNKIFAIHQAYCFKKVMRAVGNIKTCNLQTRCFKIYTLLDVRPGRAWFYNRVLELNIKSILDCLWQRLLLFPSLKLSQNECQKLLLNFTCICLLPTNQLGSGACMLSFWIWVFWNLQCNLAHLRMVPKLDKIVSVWLSWDVHVHAC